MSTKNVVTASPAEHDAQITSPAKYHCPVCTCGETEEFWSMQEIPVHVCVLEPSIAAAQAATRGSIALRWCTSCGHVYNAEYQAAKVRFDPSYEASLEYSPTFRAHIQHVADRLIHRYDLHGKQILEVGCGSGFFLAALCQLGDNHGTGFDPSVVHDGAQVIDNGSLTLVRDFFDNRYADLTCDFLCCLSVIEGIQAPLEFLKSIRAVLGERRVNCYFEVYNGERPFSKNETFSIHYEQCNYFSKQSFETLVQGAGFDILDLGECYQGDQYLYIEACSSRTDERMLDRSGRASGWERIEDFTKKHRDAMENWQQRLREFEQSGKKVVLWGSGGKGISFLNMVPSRPTIEYVVDINHRRQGLHVPGTGQKIVSPEFLRTYKPDYVLLSNPLYEREIRETLNSLQVACQVVGI